MVHYLYHMVQASVENDVALTPRERLLHATLGYIAAHGLQDLSLRELAAGIGTSHRMLIYHFGSKEGLLRAVVEEVENQQREFFTRFIADLSVPPLEAAQAFWKRLTDPALANNVRLFFELYGQALAGRPGLEGFLDHIVDAWVEPLTEYAVVRGASRAIARADARLGVAVSRGLLLDLVATGERAEVDAAYQRFLALSTLTSGASLPARPATRPRTRSHVSRNGDAKGRRTKT
jgi:AcrR family transcriptional regulator